MELAELFLEESVKLQCPTDGLIKKKKNSRGRATFSEVRGQLVGPRDQSQVARHSRKCLYLLRHLASPVVVSKCFRIENPDRHRI